MFIREIEKDDLQSLLLLYAQFRESAVPEIDDRIRTIMDGILCDPNHHILTGWVEDQLVSSCVINIIRNFTHDQRPYALVENVITHKNYRKKGYAFSMLNYAKEIAAYENCYKIMLMTGSKEVSTLRFYEKAGYNRNDKTGFICWLP